MGAGGFGDGVCVCVCLHELGRGSEVSSDIIQS